MPEQIELSCVSCGTSFDPAPNGGFCPDCDTPHPDYDGGSTDDAADDGESESMEAEFDESEDVAEGSDDAADDADEEPEVDGADEDEELDEDDATDDESEESETDEVDEELETDEADEELDADDAAEDEDEGEEPSELECSSCGTAVDESMSFCPDCGTEVEADDEPELSACPDCGNAVDDESYCPDCGTHLDPIRDGQEPADDDPEDVTLLVDGESYTFGDGDTFGRQDAEWLEDLVAACGGREAVTYVSSDHLEFAIEDDGVYVTDVSTNGTKHNGTDLDGDEAKLEDGDTLELADRAELEVKL